MAIATTAGKSLFFIVSFIKVVTFSFDGKDFELSSLHETSIRSIKEKR